MISTVSKTLKPIDFGKRLADHYLGKSKLVMYVDPDDAYVKSTDPDFQGILGNYAYIKVRNIGKSKVKNCIAELKSIEELRDNIFCKIQDYRHVKHLRWFHGVGSSPDNEDTVKRLNICHVHRGRDAVHFSTEKRPNESQEEYPPGEYRIRIRIRGNKLRSVEKEFIVTYRAGEFDSLEIHEKDGQIGNWCEDRFTLVH